MKILGGRMKLVIKSGFIFVLMLTFTALPIFAQVKGKSFDMNEGSWYRVYWHNNSGGDYVFALLQNNDYVYGDSYSGQGHVALDEDNAGIFMNICNAEEWLSPNGDDVTCDNTWHNKNEDFRSAGKFTKISDGGKSIWGYID